MTTSSPRSRPRLTSLVATVAAAACAGVLLLAPTSASAATVRARCGATLTSDAYLAADLVCAGDALTLTGDVVLDLRGHRLSATGGTAVSVLGDGSPTVWNGRITDSTTGLGFPQEETEDPLPDRQVTISAVTFARNELAVDASGTSPFFQPGRVTDVTISRSRFLHNRGAVSGVFTGAFEISRSRFVGNDRAVSIDTGSVTVTRSRFLTNGTAFACVEAQPCSLTRSRLQGNPVGVSVQTSTLTLERSRVSGGGTGVLASVGFGLALSRNTIDHNTTGVDLTHSAATLTRNEFVANATGYTAASQDDGFSATLDRNIFLRNRDGVFTEEAGTALKDNKAVGNRRWGLYAPQATDLGGNRAFRNGRSPQCVGVAC